MGERNIVIDKLRLNYKGLFKVDELYKFIDEWCRDKGYDKAELKNTEEVKQTGKNIELDIEPYKKLSDYAKSIIHVRIIMSDIKEVEIEKNNVKITMNQGNIQMIFDGWLETDYEGEWEGNPVYFFMRKVFEKYVFKPFGSGFEKYVASDLNHLHSNIKSFLNLYRYSTTPYTSARYDATRF